MANKIAAIIWGLVVAIVLTGVALKTGVITPPKAPKTVEPLVMGISPSACRHLMDIGRTTDYFKCMGVNYVTPKAEPKQ